MTAKLTAPQARALNYLANQTYGGYAVHFQTYEGSLVAGRATWGALSRMKLVFRRSNNPATFEITEAGRAALTTYNEMEKK